MRHKVAGIGHPVALDIGRGRVGRVGPPIVALGGEVMRLAGAARVDRGRDAAGLGGQRRLGHMHDAGALEGPQVEVKGEGHNFSKRLTPGHRNLKA